MIKLDWRTKNNQSYCLSSDTQSDKIMKIFVITANSLASPAIAGLVHSSFYMGRKTRKKTMNKAPTTKIIKKNYLTARGSVSLNNVHKIPDIVRSMVQ